MLSLSTDSGHLTTEAHDLVMSFWGFRAFWGVIGVQGVLVQIYTFVIPEKVMFCAPVATGWLFNALGTARMAHENYLCGTGKLKDKKGHPIS